LRLSANGSLQLKLAKARKKAKAVQGLVAEGRDPVTEERRKKAQPGNTLKAIVSCIHASAGGGGAVVRAAQDRVLAGGGRLFSAAAEWPTLGTSQVKVQPRPGDKGRTSPLPSRQAPLRCSARRARQTVASRLL
jgi:hypothetical protein